MQRPEGERPAFFARPAAKAFIAFALHRPGLWLLCGVKVSATVRRRNTAVAMITAAIMAVSGMLAPKGYRLATVLAVWGAGHLLWGIYLAFAVTQP
jgi:hypothetical protein